MFLYINCYIFHHIIFGFIVPRRIIYVQGEIKMKKYIIFLVVLCAAIVTISGSVSAAEKPVANFTADQTYCFDPLPVQFYDRSSGEIDSYHWNFGDGKNSTQQNPHHTYTRPGLFTVTLTVTGPGGSDTKKEENFIDVKDKDAPVPKAGLKGGLYNKDLTINLTAIDNDPDTTITIYYTLDGKDPKRNNQPSSQKLYTGPININKNGITILKFIAMDSNPNTPPSAVYTETYILDKVAPKVTANLKTGLYKTNKKVILKMNEPGTLYYTLNGITHKTKSLTKSITISSTKTLKFFAVDKAGNKSPVYTKTYTIDKTKPKMVSSSNKNKSTISRTSTFRFKFSEKVKNSTQWSKIYVKNLKTGKKVAISKYVKNNTLYIKTSKRSASTWYQIYIPRSSVKDVAGNSLNKGYVYKFKTGKA